jgi:hypothetical protein
MTRASTSAAPPAANVLRMRTGRDGHSSAATGVAAVAVHAKAVIAANAQRAWFMIVFLPGSSVGRRL